MITKANLLAGLKELVNAEEGMVTLYANFAKVLVSHTDELSGEEKEIMEKHLSELYKDSSRHYETVNNMIREITGSSQDEY